MKRPLAHLLLPLSFSALCSCGWLGGTRDNAGPTLADLQPARLPDTTQTIPARELDELSALYREALASNSDAGLRTQVMERLAGLEMLRSEKQLTEQTNDTGAGLFAATIASYRQLLAEQPNSAGNDRLLYQLAKAYELDGQMPAAQQTLRQLVASYPASPYAAEAQFRIAEQSFADGNYQDAEQAYGAVIARGESTSYYRNALYMRGWSQFKRADYEASLTSFVQTLDALIPDAAALETLARSERELVDDCYRAMGVAFSYLEGAASVTRLFAEQGERHYQPQLYRQLGDLYLSQQRYRDSADTYRAFIDAQPLSPLAPEFHVAMIGAFEAGQFSADVVEQKGSFVDSYQPNSPFWLASSADVQQRVLPSLKLYVSELARHHHATAQGLQEIPASKKADEKGEVTAAVEEHYRKAAVYYQLFVAQFPLDHRTVDMLYLLAEVQHALGNYLAAIDAYERVAWQYPDDSRAADAGYAAIVSYARVTVAADQQAAWQQRRVNSQLRFGDQFRSDARAVPVVANAAQTLMDGADYVAAIAAAQRLVSWPTPLDSAHQRTAWLVIGHSRFELGDFLLAEQAYQKALQHIDRNDALYAPTEERLAASIYKQGELAAAGGDTAAAAAQYLRVVDVAPNSTIRATAQYDAASTLLASGQTQQAVSLLGDFRSRFPSNALTVGIAAKLATVYEAEGQWQAAGDEYMKLYQQESDPQAKRQSLYTAATYYQRAGDNSRALQSFSDYVKLYPRPHALAMEARYQVSELYLAQKALPQRNEWLTALINADKNAGSERDERSRYLAAWASSEFAQADYQAFLSVPLNLPIKISLASKKTAMQRALASWQQTNSYGVAEFSTQAAFHIGAIYARLSADLMASERPANLDELELEQYDILLEEQAFPFEEKAIDIHEKNAERSREGVYDEWVKASFAALAQLLPSRYGKREQALEVSRDIY